MGSCPHTATASHFNSPRRIGDWESCFSTLILSNRSCAMVGDVLEPSATNRLHRISALIHLWSAPSLTPTQAPPRMDLSPPHQDPSCLLKAPANTTSYRWVSHLLLKGGVRGPSFPSDLNLIFWASSSIWAFPDVLGLNLNISYIVKCLHHQCPIRQFPPTYSSILVFSVPKTIMYSERKISSTILPSRSPNSVITGSIEIHLVSRINIVGGRADISGRYPKVFSCGLLPRFPPYVSISSFIVSNSIMELEMMLDPSRSPYVSLKMLSTMYKIQIIFSEITDGDTVVCLLDYLSSSSYTSVQTHSLGCINVVYDYSKLVGAFNSGIKVKIIQGFLHIEQASPTNIISSVLMYSLLFILSSTMAPVVTT
ncbi:unnamed protein product [Brassica napus]|uniref:(rape) hypothetical protein n=1 Tax=Brassica napus TaxID=3708 RepID=A0A816RD85_BRANA|nr:unnamed protein product [Brassica napus]